MPGKARPLRPPQRPRPDRTPGPVLARGLRRGGKGGAVPGQAAPPHLSYHSFTEWPRPFPNRAQRRGNAAEVTDGVSNKTGLRSGRCSSTPTPRLKQTVPAMLRSTVRPPPGESGLNGSAARSDARAWRRGGRRAAAATIGQSTSPREGREGGCVPVCACPGPPFPYLAPAHTGPGRRRFRGAAGTGPERGTLR